MLLSKKDLSFLAQEVLHKLHIAKPNEALMAIKINLQKAYDNINRSCILEVMRRFGFSPQWCSLVEEYISSLTFSIIFNSKSSHWFRSNCGIRQGDLSSLGTSFDKNISLLVYADDVMIITKATPKNALTILEVLSNFIRWTGL